MNTCDTVPVFGKRLLNEFLRFPWKIYKNDPNWVPPLLYQQREMFDKKRFPFHFHSTIQPFLCMDSAGQTVGRICAIYNKRHLKFHKDGRGFFGFFEAFEDLDIAGGLFRVASQWLKERGCTHIRGPANFSTNEECGLLVDGFNSPPVFMMTYNPRYYIDLLENTGFSKVMDLYAYLGTMDRFPTRYERASKLLKRRYNATVRPLNFKRIKEELELTFSIYNSSWANNWGFIPMTRDEFLYIAKDFTKIADPSLILILTVSGRPVGFSIALPDLNVAFSQMNGRLFPLGIFKFFYYKRKIKRLRIPAMGIIKEYRGLGLDSLLYLETALKAMKSGYNSGEFSWVLETNTNMNISSEKMGAKRYKTYRFYEREI
jgi:hypothetical protein